ncbi:MAG: ATP-dependent helicase [Caldilineaceae bacterium]|nr:ATP-dependent helicase [Caldilineaceae bacterium]
MSPLTPQQQLVVAHDRGPALVFATAGAGKTTTMTARIERLVRQGVFRPGEILATSFNRDAADAIKRNLKRRGVEGVKVQTLHGLGYGIVRQAARLGLLPAAAENSNGFEGIERRILWAAMDEARRHKVAYAAELNRLDQDDFLSFVARSKGNLCYADLSRVELSPAARRIAAQVKAPDDRAWYLPLFRLYEDVRRGRGWISYDDMVTSAWEVLMAQPSLLKAVQSAYACLLVDEFQDVNLAQAELVELIARPHGNLMVIGDDDQTIYEWRGAQPRFILDFEKRHKAKVYFLEDNFRCRASHVALANAVIQHSQERSPKTVRLTQGFDGETALHRPANEAAQGQAVVEQVQRALRDGRRSEKVPMGIAVLVRLFAQTAAIEASLLEAGIPYRVEGERPFYQREEAKVLLDYIRLGQIEADLLAGRPLSDDAIDEFFDLWPRLRNRPNRYLPKALGEEIGRWVAEKQQPLHTALRAFASRSRDRGGDLLEKFAGDLRWLAGQVQPESIGNRPASALLSELDNRLGYRDELLRSSGDESLGRAKAGAIDALLQLAQGQGSVERFIRFVGQLESSHQRRKGGAELVTLTTIYRAKGLEWPVVLLPGISEGILPYERGASLAEERRLLYVAITRAQERLHLFALADRPLSRFLQEADAENVLAQVGDIRHALSLPPARWGAEELQAAAVTAKGLGFYSFFAFWWSGDELYRQQMAQAILSRLSLPAEDRRFWQALAEGRTPASSPGQAAPVKTKLRRGKRAVVAPSARQPRFQRTRQRGNEWLRGMGAFFTALRQALGRGR